MRKISSPSLAQLLLQLRYTPANKRRNQLESAESLFSIIDKDKEYPFEFVCFRITGFHLKSAADSELIKGGDLLEDLRIFISKLSGQIARSVNELDEKIYTIKELAEDLNVSTKTIYRWRKRGLIAEKFIFEDGKRYLGFPQSSLGQFLEANPQLKVQAQNFERLTSREKSQIIQKARKLASDSKLSRHQIIAQISAKTGRSHETIRYTLLNYDKANPEKAVFGKRTGVIEPVQASEIYRLYKQGCKIKELMERYERNRSSIYRIINKRRAKYILAKKIEYVTSEEFFNENSRREILSGPIKEIEPLVHNNVKPFKLADNSLPDYLQVLKDVPELNRDNEIELFRRYNYLKYLADTERAEIKLSRVSGKLLSRIEKYFSDAEIIQRRIIEANLRLVVGIARKHISSGASLLDLVSEGNVALMQAVERFDYTRGFRFGTFASWTITKTFARKIPDHVSGLSKAKAASLASVQRDLREQEAVDFAAIERAQQSLTRVIRDNLTEREQYVIMNRFGLIGSPIKKQTKTLLQIGQELNLTKERIRQIELTALQKLRHSLSVEEFELLTG